MSKDIETAQAAFAEWRRARKKKSRVPDHLWQMAATLGKRHGYGKIAAILSVSFSTLKEKAGVKKQHRGTKGPKEIEVIKMAPIQLREGNVSPKPRTKQENKMIAEIVAPSG